MCLCKGYFGQEKEQGEPFNSLADFLRQLPERPGGDMAGGLEEGNLRENE